MPDTHADTLRYSNADRTNASDVKAPRAHQSRTSATVSAAAEFARTFAPGADTMNERHDVTTPQPGESPVSVLRRALLGTAAVHATTIVPSLGMTFGEAAAKWRELDRAARMSEGDGSDRLMDERTRIEFAVLESAPRTAGDALVVMEMLTDAAQAACPARRDATAIQRAYAVLAAGLPLLRENSAASPETSTILALGMTFRQAADRVRELLDLNTASAERDEDEAGEEGEHRRRNDEERLRLEEAMRNTRARSFGDVLVKLERMTDPEVGAGCFEIGPKDINVIADDIKHLAAGLSVSQAGIIEPSDDAELLALWRTYTTARDALNSHKGRDEGDRLADACRAAELAFLTAPARTVAGIALKFRYLRDERALDPSLLEGIPNDVLKALDTAAEAVERLAALPAGITASDNDAGLWAIVHEMRDLAAEVKAAPDSFEEATAVEERVNNRRDALFDKLFSTPARTVSGIAAKLHAVWPWITERYDQLEAPRPDDDEQTHKMWAVIKEAEALGIAQAFAISPNSAAEHPDAELLEIERDRAKLLARLRRMSEEDDPDLNHPLWNVKDALEDRMPTLPPRTGAGIAALLHVVYDSVADRLEEQNGPTSDSELRAKLLWAALKAVEQMPGISAQGQPQPDAFTDTIAAFESAAEAVLALPVPPTAAMIEAGAAAVGITTEQFNSAYAAAAGAYLKERAA